MAERTSEGNVIRITPKGQKFYYTRRYTYDLVHYIAYTLKNEVIKMGSFLLYNPGKLTVKELTVKIANLVDKEMSV